MLENEIKKQDQVIVEKQDVATSPISQTEQKTESKKSNDFVDWLYDKDTVDENNGKIDKKTATISYAKGLIEVVKTIYRKPIASIITIASAAIFTYMVGYSAVVAIMYLAIASGIAGIAYAGYNLVKPTTSNNTKQSYEILGISSFILAIGIFGLVF